MSANLEELKNRLAGVKTVQGAPDEKIETLKKGAEIKKGAKGGKRPGSGRKPSQAKLLKKGIQEWLDQHMHGKVDVSILDHKTGKTKVIKMSRLEHALTKLYQLGTKGEGDADAINKWLDRMLGKAAQVIKGDADEPIRLLIDF